MTKLVDAVLHTHWLGVKILGLLLKIPGRLLTEVALKTLLPCPSKILHTLKHSWVVIFFSLTEAPLPDPTPTPPNTPKRTRNRPETEPNGAKRSRNGAKRSRNGPKSSFLGWDGRGVCRGGGGGAVREKEYHYSWGISFPLFTFFLSFM